MQVIDLVKPVDKKIEVTTKKLSKEKASLFKGDL
jgi:hypothetical protein